MFARVPVFFLLAASLVIPVSAEAQLFDHLRCFEVDDEANFAATVNLTALRDKFGVDDDCRIRGSAHLYCVSSAKEVLDFKDKSDVGIPPVAVVGPTQGDVICYRVRCARETDGIDDDVVDQFGARKLTAERTRYLCAPANLSATTTTSTTTTTMCVPQCSGRECGDDGCGGTCGTCAASEICDDGTCKAKQGNGEACSTDNECLSGICADNSCCDSPCTGSCDACNVSGSEGSCSILPAGSSGSPSCSPYVCGGSSSSCSTSCTTDADCASTHYCDGGGSCALKLNQGSSCSTDSQCISGVCPIEDGVCCDTACDGSCEACVESKTGAPAGTCSFILNETDPDEECADQGAASCGFNGVCDGGGACAFYASGTSCTATGGICDGAGTCLP